MSSRSAQSSPMTCRAAPQHGQDLSSGSMTIFSRGRWTGSAPRLTERLSLRDAFSVASTISSCDRASAIACPVSSHPQAELIGIELLAFCGRTACAAVGAASPTASHWRPEPAPVHIPGRELPPPLKHQRFEQFEVVINRIGVRNHAGNAIHDLRPDTSKKCRVRSY